jgi:uncharacterized protein (TIGR02588 family)
VRRHPLEWGVLAASVAGLCALVALLVFDGVTRTGAPELEIAVEQPQPQGEQWVVPIVVENRGASAAAGVDIELVLLAGDRELDSGTVTLPFVPEGSEVEAAVVFREDPGSGRIEPRVLGYELP